MRTHLPITALIFLISSFIGVLSAQTTPPPDVKPELSATFTVSGPAGVHISGPTTICKGGETILKAEGNYESFEWNTGSKDRFIRVQEEGNYEVTVTTKGGCRYTTSVNVQVIPCT